MSYQGLGQEANEANIEMTNAFKQPDNSLKYPRHDSETKSWAGKFLRFVLFFLVFGVTCTIFYEILSSHSFLVPVNKPTSDDTALFDDSGRYVMRNFDEIKPNANFLAGLGGLWGVPMWAFYVNRGQGMTAFGVQNKDGAIAKFNTAEKAYQQTPFTGFRTFVKGARGGETFSHMPFFPNHFSKKEKPIRNMMIGMSEMEIEEVSTEYGLKTNVLYFTVPDEEFPSLIRRATFTNLDSDSTLTIDVLDGLGKLQPSGISNGNLDAIGRTMEAWMNVYNAGSEGGITEPFFHISQGTGDTAQVQIIKDGHFSVAFIEDGEGVDMDHNGLHLPLPVIVDPSVVFGTDTSLTNPSGFFGTETDAVEIAQLPQGTTSRTPCSFAAAKLVIPSGGSVTITSVYGHAKDLDTFLSIYSPKIRSNGYSSSKRTAAALLVKSITDKVTSTTGSSLFDSYMQQNFLDNTLRGGMPIPLGDPSDPKVYHTYSRIHGDLERDYNNFQFETTYFSQGPGNFRDVSQNRRMDVLLSPVVGDFNVRMFLSFVQADGYNPLTVATTNFKVPAGNVTNLVQDLGITSALDVESMKKLLKKSFRIGQLFTDMKAAGVTLSIDRADFLTKVVSAAKQVFAAQFAQNGFWADHWTYTLDLIDNYLSVYPDKEEYLLWDSEPVPFFMSPAVVKSRADRYTLVANPLKGDSFTVRVYSAISVVGDKDFPADRAWALQQIYASPEFVADANGAGGVWQHNKLGDTFKVSVITKLSMLGILKYSTLDPAGMGVEMEGGKPGWNDAMNGLPGLIGSGMAETYEMLRIIRFVKASVSQYGRATTFPKEFAEFIMAIGASLMVYNKSDKGKQAEFEYWDVVNTAREKYRQDISVFFSGANVDISAVHFLTVLNGMEAKVNQGIARALATTDGLTPSYFYYECVDYGILPRVNVTIPKADPGAPPAPLPAPKIFCREFTTHTVPKFLEGPVRHMKTITDKKKQLEVYQQTKASGIYDPTLKMYRLSEDLSSMGQDVGRMKAFSPGWLENQSVWLHMSYKFYLQLLRGGLYAQFYEEIATGLIPFMDNKVYGRSPLEAASFIVSSAFPDKKLHGASFLARLTGSTAEMMSMWAIMMAGQKPFTVDSKGGLLLTLEPILPGWLFTEEGLVSFTFLGEVLVTYHNPLKVDSWTIAPRTATVVYKDGTEANYDDAALKGRVAERVRALLVKSIDIFY